MQGFAAPPIALLPPLQTNRFHGVPSESKLGCSIPGIPTRAISPPFRSLTMLKLLSSSACLQTRAQHALTQSSSASCLRTGNNPLLRALNSLRGWRSPSPSSVQTVFFCSESSGDGADVVAAAEGKVAEAESDAGEKSSSAIVPTNPRPEDYLTVGYSGNSCSSWLV